MTKDEFFKKIEETPSGPIKLKMRAEKKYYTPVIEEFHIGFECEQMFDLMTWTESIIYETHDFTDLQYEIRHNHVRVKCLDMEDIEDIGWELIEREIHLWVYKKGKHKLILDYFTEYPNIIHIHKYIESLNEQKVVFAGMIKNKSKLKEIMEMVGIHILNESKP